jgi:hypothetical protein
MDYLAASRHMNPYRSEDDEEEVMKMVTRFSIVLAIAFCAIGCLAEHQPPDDDISARILVPLSGKSA